MNTYQVEKEKIYTKKVRDLQKELPLFAGSFFRGIENYTSVLTRYAYAVDLRGFFQFLVKESDILHDREIRSLTAQDLELIRAYHIELYLEQASLYLKNDREVTNRERAKARKLSTLRAFFKYCFQHEMISSNVASLVETPKLHEQAILRLEPNEVANLLDRAESGDGLTARQRRFHEATRIRDVAILTLFLGTGIRISELVGIDLDDINFEDSTFLVTRKGGKQSILAFGEEVWEALHAYWEQRNDIVAQEGHEQAFFLSLQRRRITARAVEIWSKNMPPSPRRSRRSRRTSCAVPTAPCFIMKLGTSISLLMCSGIKTSTPRANTMRHNRKSMRASPQSGFDCGRMTNPSLYPPLPPACAIQRCAEDMGYNFHHGFFVHLAKRNDTILVQHNAGNGYLGVILLPHVQATKAVIA